MVPDIPLKDLKKGLFEQFVQAPQERRTNGHSAWAAEWDLFRMGKLAGSLDDPLLWWRAKESDFPTLGVHSLSNFLLHPFHLHLLTSFSHFKRNLQSCIWPSLPLKQAVNAFSALSRMTSLKQELHYLQIWLDLFCFWE